MCSVLYMHGQGQIEEGESERGKAYLGRDPAEGRLEPQASRFDSSRQARWSRRPEQRQAGLLAAGGS